MDRRLSFDSFNFTRYAVLMLVSGLVLIPLAATVLGGFKTLGDLRLNPFGLPSEWVIGNYWQILTEGNLWGFLWNSLIIAFFTVFLTLATGAMAAYVLAHIRFFGNRMLGSYFMVGLLFPAAVAILPLFIKIRDLGLLDTYTGVILPQVAFSLGFCILLLRTFFRQMPHELFEAALIDGCSYIRFFWHFTLPLSRPILATVGIFTLVQSWNNFLLPLVVINDDSQFTWPLGIMQFRGEYSTDWTLVLAFITLTLVPAVIFFLLTQRYIVAGLTGGALKG